MKTKLQNETINQIISYFDTQKKLADKLGISQQAVSRWLKFNKISCVHALAIEKLSGGKFKRKNIRPDIYAE